MSKTVIINTKYGRLRGTIQQSFENYEYCAFKGIPYAKPPIGKLRFKDPLPPETWSGIREAKTFGDMCGQHDVTTGTIQGSDDCLYLNVYTKNTEPDAKLPVMVWIHGGAFMYGNADDFLYGPDYLLRKDIVLVTINYRLGALGFLNFEHEAAAGNQGLKDQVMALRWVKENIENFGGDPNNVTIFGESAGAVSVHYLALSPMTKGLIHKAISQSGVACNTWSCTPGKDGAYRLCKSLGNNETDPEKLVEFLQTIDIETLIEAQEKARLPKEKLQCIFAFGPGIDYKSKDPLMAINPLEAYKRGVQIPYIIGCNSAEGIFNLRSMAKKHFKSLDEHFDDALNPISIDMLKENNLTPNDFRLLYYGNEKISEKNDDKYVQWWSDLNFIDGIHRTLKAQVESSSAPTYFYRFTYDKDFSVTKTFANSSLPGASHFDEVQYLFSMGIYNLLNVERPKPGTATYRIMEQMTEMWVNFAQYGRPTTECSDLLPTYWLPITDQKVFRGLEIDEELRMRNVLNLQDQFSFGKHMKNKL